MCITHLWGIYVALFLTNNLKFSYDFRSSKPKRSKRLNMSGLFLFDHYKDSLNKSKHKVGFHNFILFFLGLPVIVVNFDGIIMRLTQKSF